MKILIVSKHFWPENFRINLVAESLSKYHEITVLSEKPSYHKQRFSSKLNSKIKIIRVWTYPRSKNLFSLFLNYLTFVINCTFKIFNIDKKNFDLIFVYATSPIFQAIPAIIFSKTKKIPSFLWVQDLWPDVLEDLNIFRNFLILKIVKKLTNMVYKNSSFIFAQSNSFKKNIQSLSKKKVDLLYNPETKTNSKFKNIKNKKLKLVFAGNIGRAQNLGILIKTAKAFQNTNIIFELYGNGSEKDKLINLIKINKLEDIIKFYRPISEKKLKIKIKNSNGLLLVLGKGKALSKTLPAKLQTYISHGKPIIVSSDGEAFKFIKTNKLGFVSKSDDYRGIIKSIQKLKKLSNNQKKYIYDRSKKIFNSFFELDMWTEKLNLKLEKNLKLYKKNKII